MEKQDSRRMQENFRRGLMWLALGAAVVVMLEIVWDSVHATRSGIGTDRGMPDEMGFGDGDFGYGDMARFVFGDEEPAIGTGGVSPVFIDECFDPRGIGEVSSSDDGGVVGIVSERGADDLYRICVDGLHGNGWIRVESGQPLRCTFLKNAGTIRWLFLDVTQVDDSGIAIIVVEEGA